MLKTTRFFLTVACLLLLLGPLGAQAQEICYAVADNDGFSGSPDQLVRIVTATGVETEVGSGLGTARVEAIAYSPFSGILYGANAGQFGSIDLATGVFSSIGSFGTGDGTLGNVTFSDVDGLHFDPYPGELYGVHRRGNGNDGNNDVMFQINRTTGQFIPNAYPDYDGDGNGDDYIEIKTGQAPRPGGGTLNLWDIDDLAIDPSSGVMYGAANNGGNNDELVQINRLTGDVTLVGLMGVTDIEGLGFNTSGQLFGSTGTGGNFPNSLYQINSSTGVASNRQALGVNGNNDYEGLACLTSGQNALSGRVYLDQDGDGVLDGGESGPAGVTVRIYRDTNQNGMVDSGEPLLGTVETDSNGDYYLALAATGYFVIDIDTGDLPSGSTMTTDNVEVAYFAPGTYGAEDTRNDFGYMPPPPEPLDIDKTSDVAGLASAGQTITYTITISNTSQAAHTGITVTDDFPSGLTYVPNSTTYTTYTTSTENVRDEFATKDYNLNNGSINWNGNWIEINDNGSAGNGDVKITGDGGGNVLQVKKQNKGIRRAVDLSNTTSATLQYQYRRKDTNAANKFVLVQISSDGGSNWTTLAQHGGDGDDASYQSASHNIASYATANTVLRLISNANNDKTVFFDNIDISADFQTPTVVAGNAPPTLVSGQTLAAGQQMVVTLQGTVPNDPDFCVVQNTASVFSNEIPTPQEDLQVDVIDESSGCVLPVELTSFDAVLDGRATVLSWTTASETNNAGFNIEHKATSTEEWNTLGWIDGYGTTEAAQSYQFRAEDLAPGRHTFRLKQIDYDGTFEYSPTVEVVVEMADRFVMESAYPNPFNPVATMRFAVNHAQQVDVALYDVLGRRVQVLWSGEAEAGRMHEVRIDGSGLSSGMYLVRAVGNGFLQTQRVTLVK